VDAESHLGVSDLDEGAAQFILQQGGVNARVRELAQGENFEIGTPNVAFRALQPGDYRIDVDPQTQQTRVIVRSGLAAVFGEGGQSLQLAAGQQATFSGRALAQVRSPLFVQDDFGLWVAERNRQEDQSIAARHVPRGVVGSSQLDAYGAWGEDPTYGAVWYPRIATTDWAPYRQGHWSWIQPWGWTWIDDAPWGFAPFHYGRWTMIGNRWAWVPGRMAARPVYSPALVVFLGGGASQFSLGAGSGPAVGWYPLAPGEAWWPWYRTSPHYVGHANHNINLNAYPRNYANHLWRQRPFAVTAVREDDFRRGRPVERHWQRVQPNAIGQAQVGVVPVRPEQRRITSPSPRLQATPPATVQPAVPQQRAGGGRELLPPAVREQYRARRQQDRQQGEAERSAREQIRQQQDPRGQQEQLILQQRNAGRIQPEGGSQRDAGRIQGSQSQRDAGRVQPEPAQRENWRQRQQDRGGEDGRGRDRGQWNR
jgi:hypothetical protein